MIMSSECCLRISWACGMNVAGLGSCSLSLCRCCAEFPPLHDSM